jgi:hypothetical protein
MVCRHQLHQVHHNQFTQLMEYMGMMGALMDLAIGMDHTCIVLDYMVDGVHLGMENTIPEEEVMGIMPILET